MKENICFKLVIWFIFLSRLSLSAEENFIFIDGHTGEVIQEIGPHIDDQYSPCSTFKIALSLMGYDAGILKDENAPVWEFQQGYDDWLPSWRVPLSPMSWMKYSCLWYSKLLSLKLGLETIRNYLVAFEYGNHNVFGGLVEPGSLDPLWVNSSLQISPREQVHFIQKMVREELSISSYAFQTTKNLLFKEEFLNGWKLYGKTGWSGSNVAKDGITLEFSWFVGWIENENCFLPFAYLIRSEEKINLDQRIPRVKQLINDNMH